MRIRSLTTIINIKKITHHMKLHRVQHPLLSDTVGRPVGNNEWLSENIASLIYLDDIGLENKLLVIPGIPELSDHHRRHSSRVRHRAA